MRNCWPPANCEGGREGEGREGGKEGGRERGREGGREGEREGGRGREVHVHEHVCNRRLYQ